MINPLITIPINHHWGLEVGLKISNMTLTLLPETFIETQWTPTEPQGVITHLSCLTTSRSYVVLQGRLKPCYSKYGQGTSSMGTTWEQAKKLDFEAHSWPNNQNSHFTRVHRWSPDISMFRKHAGLKNVRTRMRLWYVTLKSTRPNFWTPPRLWKKTLEFWTDH